jgi:hypothetical protein
MLTYKMSTFNLFTSKMLASKMSKIDYVDFYLHTYIFTYMKIYEQ